MVFRNLEFKALTPHSWSLGQALSQCVFQTPDIIKSCFSGRSLEKEIMQAIRVFPKSFSFLLLGNKTWATKWTTSHLQYITFLFRLYLVNITQCHQCEWIVNAKSLALKKERKSAAEKTDWMAPNLAVAVKNKGFRNMDENILPVPHNW